MLVRGITYVEIEVEDHYLSLGADAYSRMGMDYELSDEMRLYLILAMKTLSTK